MHPGLMAQGLRVCTDSTEARSSNGPASPRTIPTLAGMAPHERRALRLLIRCGGDDDRC